MKKQDDKRYYLAYGSNLNVPQMRRRCPGATILGTAKLRGWELLFRGSKTGSYLTIEEREGCEVPVAVWVVTPEDEAAESRQMYGCVRMNDKGQITLPVQVREAFGLKPGCLVLVLADTEKGIALMNIGSMSEGAVAVPPQTPGKRNDE